MSRFWFLPSLWETTWEREKKHPNCTNFLRLGLLLPRKGDEQLLLAFELFTPSCFDVIQQFLHISVSPWQPRLAIVLVIIRKHYIIHVYRFTYIPLHHYVFCSRQHRRYLSGIDPRVLLTTSRDWKTIHFGMLEVCEGRWIPDIGLNLKSIEYPLLCSSFFDDFNFSKEGYLFHKLCWH